MEKEEILTRVLTGEKVKVLEITCCRCGDAKLEIEFRSFDNWFADMHKRAGEISDFIARHDIDGKIEWKMVNYG